MGFVVTAFCALATPGADKSNPEGRIAAVGLDLCVLRGVRVCCACLLGGAPSLLGSLRRRCAVAEHDGEVL